MEQIVSFMIILAANKSQMIITGLFLSFSDEIFLLQDNTRVNSKWRYLGIKLAGACFLVEKRRIDVSSRQSLPGVADNTNCPELGSISPEFGVINQFGKVINFLRNPLSNER